MEPYFGEESRRRRTTICTRRLCDAATSPWLSSPCFSRSPAVTESFSSSLALVSGVSGSIKVKLTARHSHLIADYQHLRFAHKLLALWMAVFAVIHTIDATVVNAQWFGGAGLGDMYLHNYLGQTGIVVSTDETDSQTSPRLTILGCR